MATSGRLDRYVPGRDGPFGFDEAAHLFRRAGFSLTSGAIDAVARAGLEAALEQLFTRDEGAEAADWAARADTVAELGSLPALQSLWLARMAATRAPLVEKLALFWHGHFATSLDKVKHPEWMWGQYRLFREQGLGSFRALLQAVSRDPAMLVWLDSNSNERAAPNENYARELMELFSLGVGHYSEKDVQEAARAFSGWHVKDGAFWFNARAHDAGEKEVLGRRGPLDGGDVVDRCVEQRNCPRFLALKLLRFFVLPEPDDALVGEFAELLEAEKLVIEPALRRLFASRLFFASETRAALIASPVDFCVGLLIKGGARAHWRAIADAASAMGQALFAPPNVKGWDGNRAWINSRTLLERGRFAADFAFGGGALQAEPNWSKLAPTSVRADPARLVQTLAQTLLQRPLTEEGRKRLEEFARSEAAGDGETRVRRVAQLLLSSPEAGLL